MLKYFLAGTLLAFGVVPAAAADWYFIDMSNRFTSITFVDKDSIRARGTVSEGTVYMVFPDSGDGAAAIESRMEIDCATPRSRIVHLRAFDEAEAVQFDDSVEGEWDVVRNESQAGRVREFICSGGTNRPAEASRGSAHPFAFGRQTLREQGRGLQ